MPPTEVEYSASSTLTSALVTLADEVAVTAAAGGDPAPVLPALPWAAPPDVAVAEVVAAVTVARLAVTAVAGVAVTAVAALVTVVAEAGVFDAERNRDCELTELKETLVTDMFLVTPIPG